VTDAPSVVDPRLEKEDPMDNEAADPEDASVGARPDTGLLVGIEELRVAAERSRAGTDDEGSDNR
jgi:hypothetical protein